MRTNDQRIYRTFEEFEREELRRVDSISASVDEMTDSLYGELEFEVPSTRRRRDEDDEE